MEYLVVMDFSSCFLSLSCPDFRTLLVSPILFLNLVFSSLLSYSLLHLIHHCMMLSTCSLWRISIRPMDIPSEHDIGTLHVLRMIGLMSLIEELGMSAPSRCVYACLPCPGMKLSGPCALLSGLRTGTIDLNVMQFVMSKMSETG